MSMNDVFTLLDAEEVKWSPELGRLILIYSDIEDILNHTLDDVANASALRDKRTTKKLKLLANICEDNLKQHNYIDAKKLLKKIETLRNFRNLVCHNPISFSISGNHKKEIHLSLKIYSKHKVAMLTFVTLQRKVEVAQECRSRLKDLWKTLSEMNLS